MKRILYTILSMIILVSTARAQPICTMTCYNEDNGMSSGHITQMLQDRQGMIWFATWNGLERFDGYEFTNFKSHAGDGCDIANDRLRDIRLADNDDIYCRIDNGWYIFHQDNGRFEKVGPVEFKRLSQSFEGRQTKGVRGQEIVHQDAHGYQWVIDTQGQLYYQTGKERTAYPIQVPAKDIYYYYSDQQKNLWLISFSTVYKLTFAHKPGKLFPLERPAEVRCLFLDRQSRYWIATKDDKTVSVYDRKNQRLGYLTPQGTLTPHYTSFGRAVYSMADTDDGHLWLGTKPHGLFRLNAAMDKMEQFLPEESVYDIKQDPAGHLWIATLGGGLYCLIDANSEQPKIRHAFKAVNATFPTQIRYLHITNDGILLAATTEGLLVGKIDEVRPEKTVFRLHQRDPRRVGSLSSNSTMDILEDHNQQFYVSTESGGINRSKTNDLLHETLDFKYYNEESGMISDIAQSMIEYQNTIWILSSNKLMMLRPREKNASGYLDWHFFKESYHFSEAHPIQRPDGNWLFPLTQGALLLEEHDFQRASYQPTIVLTGIDIQGGEPRRTVSRMETLELNPEERSVTVYFAALDYEGGASISYAFKMDDKKEWNYIGHNRAASFASLKPGTYHLQIRSTDSNGMWADNIRTLTIEVKPTFWEAWYGQLLILLMIIAVVAIIFHTYLYIKKLKRQQRETLEAYLALLNTQSQTTPAAPSAQAPATQLNKEDEAFMARVMTFVEAHLGDADVNIGDMAEAAATSKSGLNRKMKSLTGLTPADFMREARIKRACQLLKSSETAVADIAYQCGFTDPKYFSKCFRNTLGCSPSEYRLR